MQAPLEITDADKQLQIDTDVYIAQVIQGMPAAPERLKQICQAQEQDNILQQIIKFCTEGWPDHSKLKGSYYKPVASELSVQGGLFLRGSRIVIPRSFTERHTGKDPYRPLRHYKMSRESKTVCVVAKNQTTDRSSTARNVLYAVSIIDRMQSH